MPNAQVPITEPTQAYSSRRSARLSQIAANAPKGSARRSLSRPRRDGGMDVGSARAVIGDQGTASSHAPTIIWSADLQWEFLAPTCQTTWWRSPSAHSVLSTARLAGRRDKESRSDDQ